MTAPAFYGADLAAIHAGSFTAMARAAADAVAGLLEPASYVLDVGCGDGTTAAALAASGHHVTGVDRSAAMIDLARARHSSARFDVADLTNLPNLPELDAVLAIGEVLAYLDDHAPDPLDRRLSALLGLLRPGGLLLFDLPAPGRTNDHNQRTWTAGEDWAVLASSIETDHELERQIITFRRDLGDDYRRTEELHRLQLHPSQTVLDTLHSVGATQPQQLTGYGPLTLPHGLVAYTAYRSIQPA